MCVFNRDWISHLLSIAEEAACAVNEIYNSKTYNIDSKLDNSPVTEADFKAHEIIKAGLFNLDPNVPLLSEEGESVPIQTRCHWTRFWLVDPLDGTKEFIRRTGEFTINIALIENHQPVVGVVSVPQLGHYYWAIQGKGAYLRYNGREERLQTAFHSPLQVVVSRRSYNKSQVERWATRLPEYNLSYCGSSLKICLVASGERDLYPQMGKTYEWDTAAGQCILEAAGGHLVNLSGGSLQYNMSSSLENPPFYALSNRSLIPILCG
jgi:3'(2'), 5'-bisphosphate nucleotidase